MGCTHSTLMLKKVESAYSLSPNIQPSNEKAILVEQNYDVKPCRMYYSESSWLLYQPVCTSGLLTLSTLGVTE